MDIKNFQAGNYIAQNSYKAFIPEPINHPWEVSGSEIIYLLEKSNLLLGRLDAFSRIVPDIDFFISMHIAKEATVSSRIEGTQTNIQEALLKEEDIIPEKRDDWEEVQNYIESMNFSIVQLKELPLSTRLFKEAHRILLKGVRGQHKLPGEYRTSQNWVGGSKPSNAAFVPPPHNEISRLMGDLENFLNSETLQLPHLIKIAIAHYQFETIHPFLDGNGRLGRLIITLYLVSNGILAQPTLYLSDYFEKNRIQYYDNLMRVRVNNDLNQWLVFFLNGIIDTSHNSISTFEQILKLRESIDEMLITSLGRRLKKGRELMNILYQKPSLTAADIKVKLNISLSAANDLIDSFLKIGILHEQTGFKRNRIFTFVEYLNLFK